MRPLLTFVALLVAAPALGNDVELEVVTNVVEGQDSPALLIAVVRPVSTLALELTRAGAATLTHTSGPVPAGKTVRVPLPSPVGKSRYRGTLKVRFNNGTAGEMPLDFAVEVLAPLVVRVDHASVDLAAGRLVLTMSRPTARCDYDIELDGKAARRGAVTFSGEPAGVPLSVTLPVGADDVVLFITLTCHDTAGTSGGVRLSPWKLDIPHEEVNFASGSARLEPSEQPKLDRAYDDISTAIRRYGDRIAIRLFIIGHTDSVGAAAANLELSLERAHSIAAYLKKRGVAVPIAYSGLGESALLVATPDETAEARNRRAQYVLAVEAPMTLPWRGL